MKQFLSGKKTYIVAILVGVYAALQQLGIDIPDWVIQAIGACGLATLRAAIDKMNK